MGMAGKFTLVFVLVLAFESSAHARISNFAKVAAILGCARFLAPQPLHADVSQFLTAHKTAKASLDVNEPQFTHVKARIYPTKIFMNADGLPADATDEFNFYVSDSTVMVKQLDSVFWNRAFYILSHHPEHFPYAQVIGDEATFDLKYFSQFISEVQKLNFAFF
jgi:hypothetical protein